VRDGQTHCNSTDVGLHECTGCRGNSCSWYSAMWIIFMVNYQVMIKWHWYWWMFVKVIGHNMHARFFGTQCRIVIFWIFHLKYWKLKLLNSRKFDLIINLTENDDSRGDVNTQLCDDSGCQFEMMQMSVTGFYSENYWSWQLWWWLFFKGKQIISFWQNHNSTKSTNTSTYDWITISSFTEIRPILSQISFH